MTRDAFDTIFRTVGKWGHRRFRRPFPLPGTPSGHVEDTIVHAIAIVTDAAVTRRARPAFADGNVDRPAESANVDIPARHPRSANADPVAICLPDAYVDGKRRHCVPRDPTFRHPPANDPR